MKHILLLSFTFCLLSSMHAQNPYVELSYPWLNLQQVKENKIKSIMLATVNAENATVENQVLLFFNNSGMLVKEETQSGFRHASELFYDNQGTLKLITSTYGNSQDSVIYEFDRKNNVYIAQFASQAPTDGWLVTETHYIYSSDNKLVEIQTYDGSVKSLNEIGNCEIKLVSTEKFEYVDGKMSSYVDEISKTYSFDASGNLESFSFTNSLYGISETETYSYDQNNRLVMIIWTQEGHTGKTFVTYEFYQ